MPQDFLRDPLARPGIEVASRLSLGAFDLGARAPLLSRILVGMDGSPGASFALAWTARLAADWSAQAIVTAIRVPAFAPHREGGPAWWTLEREAEGIQAIQRAAAEEAVVDLTRVGVPANEHDATGAPVEEILRAAALHEVDLVALGAARHPDAAGLRLGRVAAGVLRESPVSVLVAREAPALGPVVAAGAGVKEDATRLARRAGLPLIAFPGAGAEAAACARDVGAKLLVVPKDAEAEHAAALAPCTVLAWRAEG